MEIEVLAGSPRKRRMPRLEELFAFLVTFVVGVGLSYLVGGLVGGTPIHDNMDAKEMDLHSTQTEILFLGIGVSFIAAIVVGYYVGENARKTNSALAQSR